MKVSDFLPTNPFSGIAFVVAMLLAAGAVVGAIMALQRGGWWYVIAGGCELGCGATLTIVRWLEAGRIADDAKARRDAEEDARERDRPYEPEGDA